MGKWKHTIKVDCKEMEWDVADRIALDWVRRQAVGYCERGDSTPLSAKGRNVLGQLRNCDFFNPLKPNDL
jgi:hypothetical protein